MVLSYSYQEECPERPPYCRCKYRQDAHFQRKGCYLRALPQVLCHFFLCTTCRTHITMLPSNCVPYKQFPADDIEYCLDEAVNGRRPAEIESDRGNRLGISRSTVKRWLGEWVANSALLISISSEKLSRVFQGGFRGIYQKLAQCYGSRPFIRNLQPDLCRDYPPMGIFRPLILLS